MDINLNPFCGTEEFRQYLHDPFNYEGHTYATDGRILIRVDQRDDAAETPKQLKTFVGLISSLEARWLDPGTPFAPIPEATLIVRPEEKCGTCYGSGRCECECCDNEHECGRCDGSGTTRDEWRIARFATQDISARYIELIRGLPGIMIAFGEGEQPAVFRFDGGFGCIMPMRSRDVPSPATKEAA